MASYNRILALDTATRIQALALIEGDEQVARRHHTSPGNHADTLLHNINDMLKQQNWAIDDIDLVACGLGPGSFTGLRVGLANAKAIAVSAGAAVSGVSTLAAIARPVTALHSGPVVAAIDARRKEVYVGVYQDGPNGFECIHGDSALGPDALLELIESLVDPVVVGGGAQAYFKAGQLPAHIRSLGSGWDSPSPYSLGTLTRARVLQEGPSDIVTLEPNYIRPSDAEANLATRERARQSG